MTARDPLREWEDEALAERERIQEDRSTAEELRRLRGDRNTRTGAKRYLVPRNAIKAQCRDCGQQIFWRRVNGLNIPLDVRSVEEDTDGTRTAVSHWKVCK